MWYPKFIKQMRCEYEWGEGYYLKDFRASTDSGNYKPIVAGTFCRKCGKYMYLDFVGIPDFDRVKAVSIKEFHRIRRTALPYHRK
jgi:hypothetical protein